MRKFLEEDTRKNSNIWLYLTMKNIAFLRLQKACPR